MNSVLVPGLVFGVGEEVVIPRVRFQERAPLAVGDSCRLIQWQGSRALGRIIALSQTEVWCRVESVFSPLPRLPLEAIIALPRPQTVKKVVQTATLLGFSHLHLVRAKHSEKSYLTSHILQPGALRSEIEQALEQGFDSTPLEVSVHPRFLPFVEDVLPSRPHFAFAQKYVAEEGGVPVQTLNGGRPQACFFAIGPEAGWDPFELERFSKMGFQRVGLGPRILRVELACALLGGSLQQLFGSRREAPDGKHALTR